MKRPILFFFLMTAASLLAAPPPWWTEEETRIIDGEAPPDPLGPLNAGQLKHTAAQAKKHLGDTLAGGAGSAIDDMIANFEPKSGETYTTPELEAIHEAQFQPVNLGQLKAVALPFYERLLSAGYDVKANLIAHGYPSGWKYDYPWDPHTPLAENYKPANLAQLKMVFSFDLGGGIGASLDGDGDGMSDQWEDDNSLSNADGDEDNDGYSNLAEYLAGTDPNTPDGEVGTAFAETELQVFTPLE